MVAGSSSSEDKLPKRQKTTEERMSSQSAGIFMRVAIFKQLIRKEILDGRDVEVSFDNFPYYLSEYTKSVLIEHSCRHLKYSEQPQYTSVLRTMKQGILLSGPAGSEIYEEMLAKALANYSEAKLLIFDSHSIMVGLIAREAELQEEGNSVEKSKNTVEQNSGAFVGTRCSSAGTSKNPLFKKGDRVKFIGSYVSRNLYASFPSRVPSPTSGYRGIVALPFDDNPVIGVKFDIPIPGIDFAGPCISDHGYLYFCNAKDLCLEGTSEEDIYISLISTLFEAVCRESMSSPFILFIKDAMKSVVGNAELYAIFKSRLENLPKNVIVIGSTQTHMDNHKEKESFELMHDRGIEFLRELFPNKVTMLPPQDKSLLITWKQQVDRDSETLRMKGNLNCLRTVLCRRGFECDVLETLRINEQSLTDKCAEEVVTFALIHHLMQNPEANPNAKLTLSGDSIQHGLGMLQPNQNESNSLKSLKDVVTENRFEETLLHEVIPPNDIGLTYEDIGGLENVKERLKELVMLPLQGPEHFCKDQLSKLLFGPPGTGKTMLAKAVAAETGANFISLSMSSIISKCFGDEEKYVKAVFTLASKIAPSVVVLDEVDTMFGRGENRGEEEDMSKMKSEWKIPREHEDMRKMKNEFMANLDGLRTKDRERVLVLAVTNRPYDLDEAIIRRLPHRLMVNLPDAPDRAKILKVILSEQDLSADVDLNLVAKMTNGYSGSDLKNLCVTAADYPVRKKRKEHSAAQAEGKPIPALSKEDLHPLNIDDFKKAHKQVCAFVKPESEITRDFQHWNTLYCEGDSTSTNYFT